MTGFSVRGEITHVEVIASGRGIRILAWLSRLYGKGMRPTMSRAKRRFVVCVRNGSYKASLQRRKIYKVLEDPVAEARAFLRVVDESGEDYLFPADLFVPIEVPARAQLAFARSASASGVSRPARRSRRPATE